MRGKGGKAYKRTTSRGRKIKRHRPRSPFPRRMPIEQLVAELVTRG